MACRGVHFAIDNKTYERLLTAGSDEAVIDIVQEEIEEEWDEKWLRETDKAWVAIHRCLTDGTLESDSGSFPLNAVILGGKQLHHGDNYIIAIITPDQVSLVAEALRHVDKSTLKHGCLKIQQSNYDGEISTEDFEYTWDWFKELPALFSEAATAGRAVLFSVDQ